MQQVYFLGCILKEIMIMKEDKKKEVFHTFLYPLPALPSLFLLQEPKKVKSEGIKAEKMLEELMKMETP